MTSTVACVCIVADVGVSAEELRAASKMRRITPVKDLRLRVCVCDVRLVLRQRLNSAESNREQLMMLQAPLGCNNKQLCG
jgi:hypothetical protein